MCTTILRIEIIRGNVENYTLAQTMLRVKDPVKSLDFYQTHFNMSLVAEKHFSDFSLFFLASVPAGRQQPQRGGFLHYSTDVVWGTLRRYRHGAAQGPQGQG